jgi:hypothetical protein
MNRHEYLKELRRQLTIRGVGKRKAKLIVAEAESHLHLSGEDPEATFGPPDRYAASLVPDRHWHITSYIGAAAPATAACLLAAQALRTLLGEGGDVTVRTYDLLMLAIIVTMVVIVSLPAVGWRFRRSPWWTTLGAALAGGLAAFVVMLLFEDRTLWRLSAPVAFAVAGGLLAIALVLTIAPLRARR